MQQRKKQLLSILDIGMNMKKLAIFIFVLPVFAFFSCVFLTIYKDSKVATKTHCRVANVFPSISTAIGDFYPQSTIWRMCIALDSFPRYLLSLVQYKCFFKSRELISTQNSQFFIKFVRIAYVFNIIEITSLSMLTFISSKEYHFGHAVSFSIFLACSTIYMCMICICYKWVKCGEHDLKSFKLKRNLLIVYISSVIAALYFYVRHNTYCEPYVFSGFSLCEYVTVLTNIAFHIVAFYDLKLHLPYGNYHFFLINSPKYKSM